MDVRVWGVVEDRLVEVRVEPAAEETSDIWIVGLPDDRVRTTLDRVGAALVNGGLVREAPAVVLRLEPGVAVLSSGDLDLAFALAALAWTGRVGKGLRWILATGRLGLDGVVHSGDGGGSHTLAEVVEGLCHTPVVEYERMFEEGSNE